MTYFSDHTLERFSDEELYTLAKKEIQKRDPEHKLDPSPTFPTELINRTLAVRLTVRQAELSSSLQIVSGGKHTLLLSPEGQLYTFGDNQFGQLGLGDDQSRFVPTLVKALGDTRIVMVAAGEFHSLALDENGKVYSFGNNVSMQLGASTKKCETSPIAVPGFETDPAVMISAGQEHSLILTASGAVYGFGSNLYQQIETQLGSAQPIFEPTRLVGALDKTRVVRIHAGYQSSLFIAAGGDVYGCGDNRSGQLAYPISDATSLNTPTKIPALCEQNSTQFSTSLCHLTLLSKTGTVRLCGSNLSRSIASLTPDELNKQHELSDLPEFTDIACTQVTSFRNGIMALDADGKIHTLGGNFFGERGLGHRNICDTLTGVAGFAEDTKIAWIAGGYHHGFACSTTGIFFAWGRNCSGQLGLGHHNNCLFATRIDLSPFTSKLAPPLLLKADSVRNFLLLKLASLELTHTSSRELHRKAVAAAK